MGSEADQTSELRRHCEIRLLIYLEREVFAPNTSFPYFGCSKRACYLCEQFLAIYRSGPLASNTMQRGVLTVKCTLIGTSVLWKPTTPEAWPGAWCR
ncbi:hypothetical protein BKA63DRAFT_516228 [Paraphoma chrysanthemicola]|nr:hypothetical protein BKA63DRAFT_516228 [Paraphoma chrysanthemicola]